MEMQNVVELAEPGATAQLGRYRLIATLGQGGMGAIRLAVAGGFTGFRKLFVLKILKEQLACDEKFVEMFMHEATLAARLSHPNVVQTLEAGQLDGRYFLVMEFLDGQPFSEVMRRADADLADQLALRLQVLCDALAGLHYAHELTDYDGRALHLVHRDVSPANVFVTYDGQVKLLDFGIAKALDSEETRPGQFKGKVGYAAPEQFRGQPADRRVDVFAAGVVLWETIALRHLVRGKSARAIVEARLAGTEPRIAQVVEDVDPVLAAICDRAMHNDPEQRYPSADALRRALADYLAARGQSVSSAALKHWMRSKFASERAAMHRVIDRQLRALGDGEPLLEAWTLSERQSTPAAAPIALAFDSAADPDSVTEDLPAPESAAPPPQAAARLWAWAAAGALLALVVGGIQLRSSGSLRAPLALPGDVAAPVLPARGQTHMPSSSAARSAATTDLRREPAQDGADTDERTSNGEALGQQTLRSAPTRGQTDGEDGVQPELPMGKSPPEQRRTKTENARAPRERPRKRPARSSAAPPASKGAASGEGRELDLRRIPRRELRQLDVDNPFR